MCAFLLMRHAAVPADLEHHVDSQGIAQIALEYVICMYHRAGVM